ncbi:MAG TPA: hypothetical protein VHZ04_02695 [Candidatus Paceibacterota bacterium]|jgi:hypothetical protein|nr:hypothetical protein [Candidatus Paceibacterota bacterium]
METILKWNEWWKWKRRWWHYPFVFVVVVWGTVLIPGWSKDLGIVLIGVIWHGGWAENAAWYWIAVGISPPLAQILAVAFGTVAASFECYGLLRGNYANNTHGVSESMMRHPRLEPWIKRVPYFFIISLGLFSPIGGFLAGVAIARYTKLPKVTACIWILGINLVRLTMYNEGFSRLKPPAFLMHNIHWFLR